MTPNAVLGRKIEQDGRSWKHGFRKDSRVRVPAGARQEEGATFINAAKQRTTVNYQNILSYSVTWKPGAGLSFGFSHSTLIFAHNPTRLEIFKCS